MCEHVPILSPSVNVNLSVCDIADAEWDADDQRKSDPMFKETHRHIILGTIQHVNSLHFILRFLKKNKKLKRQNRMQYLN